MTKQQGPGPEQGEFIRVADLSGQMAPRDFANGDADPVAAMSVREHHVLLQNALSHLAAAGAIDLEISQRIRNHGAGGGLLTPQKRRSLMEERKKSAEQARENFIQAMGNDTLVAAGFVVEEKKNEEGEIVETVIYSEKDKWRDDRSDFSDFMKEFYKKYVKDPDHPKEDKKIIKAHAERRKLERTIRRLFEEQPAEFIFPDPETERRSPKAGDSEDLPDLKTPDRLRVIMEDPRAGFLPTTNREKNSALCYLDYLDSDVYAFGVNNQFLEVFTHSQVLKRFNLDIDPERGPLSITYEFGDYLFNAIRQGEVLMQLAQQLRELPNPNVTLKEEKEWLKVTHPGFAPLIRYRDIKQLMETGAVKGTKDPLLTREDRWTREGPGKHKTVEDIYTKKEVATSRLQKIRATARRMTVGEAKALIEEAIADQKKREAFWRERLIDIALPPEIMQGKAREVLLQASDVAMAILDTAGRPESGRI